MTTGSCRTPSDRNGRHERGIGVNTEGAHTRPEQPVTCTFEVGAGGLEPPTPCL
jgi:hypothetical protein